MPAKDNIAALLGSVRTEFVNPGAIFTKYSEQLMAKDEKQADREERAKNRAEDVLFRNEQADRAQANADRAFSLQGLTEQRAAEEQAQKMATAEAQARASEYLNAARQDVVTPQQADAILAAYNKNPKADVLGMQAKAVQQYNASPTMQKQFIGNVNIDQGPMERTVKTIDPTTGQVVDKLLSVSPDMAQAQARKDMILSGLDRTIADDKSLAMQQAKLNQDNLHHKQNYNLKLRELNDKKTVGMDEPISMFRIMDDGQVQKIKVPLGSASKYTKEGFQLGEVGGTRYSSATSKTGGTGKVDLQAVGGSKLIGGTSGDDLVAMAWKMKNKYPHIPMPVIEAEIASNVGKQWFTDSPDSRLNKELEKYSIK